MALGLKVAPAPQVLGTASEPPAVPATRVSCHIAQGCDAAIPRHRANLGLRPGARERTQQENRWATNPPVRAFGLSASDESDRCRRPKRGGSASLHPPPRDCRWKAARGASARADNRLAERPEIGACCDGFGTHHRGQVNAQCSFTSSTGWTV